jgi:hypothetical protein
MRKSKPVRKLQKIAIRDIQVRGKHRPLAEKAKQVIADSMKQIGLNMPITVRLMKRGPIATPRKTGGALSQTRSPRCNSPDAPPMEIR